MGGGSGAKRHSKLRRTRERASQLRDEMVAKAKTDFFFFLALNTHIHIHPASGLITEIVCTTLLIFSKNGSSPPIDANAKPSWIGKVGVLRLQARSPTKVCGS